MIGKIPKTGRGFRGAFNYLMFGPRNAQKEPAERTAWFETRNMFIADIDKVPAMMRATASQSTRVKKPVYHLVLSWRDDENPSADHMRLAADTTLADLGLHEHEAFIAAHHDTQHRHLHILVNRVHPETGKAWHTSKDWERLEISVARQAREMGYIRVEGRHNTPEKMAREAKRARDAEYQMATRREGVLPQDRFSKEEILSRRKQLGPLFDQARSWDQLSRLLAAEGLAIHAKGQGLVISDGMGFMKLSDLGKEIRLKPLEQLYGETFAAYDKRRDHEPMPQPARPEQRADLPDRHQPAGPPAHTPQSSAPDAANAEPLAHQRPVATGQFPDDRITHLRDHLRPVFEQARSWDQLSRQLAAEGLQLKTILNPQTNRPQLVVTDGASHARLSALSENLGQRQLEQLFAERFNDYARRDELGLSPEAYEEHRRNELREAWITQRRAAETPTPSKPSPAATDTDDTAGAGQRELPKAPPPEAPSDPRTEAFKRMGDAHASLALARQLYGAGMISKQDLIRARNDMTAARDNLAQYQTFDEFVADGVRKAFTSAVPPQQPKPQPKPKPKPTKRPARKRGRDDDRDR